tara:strand:+ start:650 stop:1129 length:480 start_codon:yes stop_codon:yes gene_type:complete
MKTLSNIAKKILGGSYEDILRHQQQQLRSRNLSNSSFGNINPSSSYNFPSYQSSNTSSSIFKPSLGSNTSSSIFKPSLGSSPTSIESISSNLVEKSAKKCEETTQVFGDENSFYLGLIIFILVLAITGLCIWFFILRDNYNNKKVYIVDDKKKSKRSKD